jgi:poly(A) polymerase
MMRAVALAARLDFTIDQPVLDAIHLHRHEIARSSAPRLLEEYYKILRGGSSERTFRELAKLGLIEPISAELHHGAAESLWQSLAALDGYRRRFESAPDTLTNAILLGSLLEPLGLSPGQGRSHESRTSREGRPDDRPSQKRSAGPTGPRLGDLPLARRDIERLRQILTLQRRLGDLTASPRAKRGVSNRTIFREALTWLEIHGNVPEIVEHWKALLADTAAATEPAGEITGDDTRAEPPTLPRRRRRRRRRRFRPAPQ